MIKIIQLLAQHHKSIIYHGQAPDFHLRNYTREIVFLSLDFELGGYKSRHIKPSLFGIIKHLSENGSNTQWEAK